MFRKLIDFLGSLRVTIVLIVSLGAVFLLGLWIPQKAVLDWELYRQWQVQSPRIVAFLDTLGFTEIYTSPITLSLWVLFFVNLATVVWRRIPLVRRKIACDAATLDDPAAAPGFPVKRMLQLPAGVRAEDVLHFFRHAGYRISGTAARFYGVKNRLSPVASLLFHLSFFLMLLGGVISIYTRFVGQVDLATGESFRGELERYGQPPHLPKFGAPPRLDVTVQGIVPLVEGSMPTGLAVRIRDEAGTVDNIDINRPYKRGHTELVIKDLGVAPLFILRDGSGREIDGAFLKLNVLKGKEDGFRLGGMQFHARFFPNYVVQQGKPETKSDEFANPAFMLAPVRDGAVGEEIAIRPGETIEVDGVRLYFAEMRFWVRFIVIREYGLELLYAGFAVATIALILRLVFYRREILGSFTTSGHDVLLAFAGRSEFYRALAEDEFDGLLAVLVSRFHAERDGATGQESDP